MPSKLSIVVFIASPRDYARCRHAALYFEFFEDSSTNTCNGISSQSDAHPRLEAEPHPERESGSTPSRTPTPGLSSARLQECQDDIKSCMMEVIGSPGFFTFHERLNTAFPVAAAGLARAAFVATIPDTVSISSLRAVVSGTPFAGQEIDWNAQNWVGDALERLVTAGYLTPEQKDKGLDEMVDIILEAADEESA
ncbi:Uncharacterized protein PECH_007886 [Penicillium ucsense]|uniref:Uncharacterized protein n=1 Tax=Penicillium ucsense TaxID=2839758 RepID=A0A8J8WG72_9EURO|nr:Uncharacterized protein PECM_007776 [Penicillium ucsense]KAF7734521.1 Uncharacterized protein PECH_007886 [Penicillium ucsense]